MLLTLPLLLGASGAAHAADAAAKQKPYPKWFDYNPVPTNTIDTHGVPYDRKYYVKTPSRVFISLQRGPNLPADKVVLHLALDDAYTGCPKLGDLAATTSIEQSSVSVVVSDYTVDMRRLPQYVQQCSTKQQYPSVDIVMSKDDLIGHGIANIRMQMGKGIDIYDLSVDNEKMMLVPSQSSGGAAVSFRPQNIRNVQNPLMHWFYPENTLILTIPTLASDAETGQQIAAFAEKNGLTPLQHIYPDFHSPLVARNHFYYVDTKGDIAAKIKPGNPGAIGMVSIMKPVYGLIADETAEEDAAVFARRPDIYE
jgi:hypothetical protein